MTKTCPKSRVNIRSKVASISGPGMLRNIIGPDIDATLVSIQDTVFGIFGEISFLQQKEENFKKQKEKTHTHTTICDFKHAQKHYKLGKVSQNNLGPDVDETRGPDVDSKKPNLRPGIDSTTYIYICCEVIIWSKFGGFWKLLSGPSWVFGSYYLVQVCVFSL